MLKEIEVDEGGDEERREEKCTSNECNMTCYLETFNIPYAVKCTECKNILDENTICKNLRMKNIGKIKNEEIFEMLMKCKFCEKNEITFVRVPIMNCFVCTKGAAKVKKKSKRKKKGKDNNSKNSYKINKKISNSSTNSKIDDNCSRILDDHNCAVDKAIDAYREIDKKNIFMLDSSVGIPYSNNSQIMLTDYYQILMCYVYWKNKMQNEAAVFEVFFRRCPFNGEFSVFAGVNEFIRFINTFKFSKKEIYFLKLKLPNLENEFFEYLTNIDGSKLSIHGILEGTMVFANEPLIRVEGPLGVCQIIETTVVNILNFATLVVTNAARFRMAAGWNKVLLEFGARRAQGGDGAMSASRYAYMGGFDATSNLRAAFLFDIPLKGTHAHSFITSFFNKDLDTNEKKSLGRCGDFTELVLGMREKISELWPENNLRANMHKGELSAFIAYAHAFPNNFLCLVDTYDTLLSGVPNFLCVALSLIELEFEPIGIRMDSGDLAYLSKEIRYMFDLVSKSIGVDTKNFKIVASNDINESVLKSLNEQGHEIDIFGIGTNLVTCQAQPALGMVYKLVELKGSPCMKLSQEISKVSLPSKKNVFRLYNKCDFPVCDYIQSVDIQEDPKCNEMLLCRHIYNDVKKCYILPKKVEKLLLPLFIDGCAAANIDDIHVCRSRCISQLRLFRSDHLRLMNPTPYKVSLSEKYFNFFRKLWNEKSSLKQIE